MGALHSPLLSRSEQLVAVAGEVASVVKQAWGRGPSRTTAHWAGPDVVLVLMESGHTDAERTLRSAGYGDDVLHGRQALQDIVEDELCARVTRVTGRPVQTVLSTTRLDPDVTAEVFMLGAEAAAHTGQDTVAQDLRERASKAAERSLELAEQTDAVSAETKQYRSRRQQRRRAGS